MRPVVAAACQDSHVAFFEVGTDAVAVPLDLEGPFVAPRRFRLQAPKRLRIWVGLPFSPASISWWAFMMEVMKT